MRVSGLSSLETSASEGNVNIGNCLEGTAVREVPTLGESSNIEQAAAFVLGTELMHRILIPQRVGTEVYVGRYGSRHSYSIQLSLWDKEPKFLPFLLFSIFTTITLVGQRLVFLAAADIIGLTLLRIESINPIDSRQAPTHHRSA